MAVAVLATAMLLACYSDTVYHHYYPTDLGGWDRAEVFEHNVSPVANGGYYVEEVGIRADASFPYRSVSLVIDQWIIHTQNKQGQALGRGVNLRQYTCPFRSVKLQQGDSISLQIHHNMKNKSVSGIANVGLRVSFQYAE